MGSISWVNETQAQVRRAGEASGSSFSHHAWIAQTDGFARPRAPHRLPRRAGAFRRFDRNRPLAGHSALASPEIEPFDL